MPEHVEFARYFQRGEVDGVAIDPIDVGRLQLPSGSVVVADPSYFTADFTRPFRRKIAPGAYALEFVIADLEQWGSRVAFARLRLSSNEVETWEWAETTAPGELNVFFGVDAGMACFADADAAAIFARVQTDFYAKHPDGNYYNDVLSKDFPSDAYWGEHRPDPKSLVKVFVCGSGFGDGLYAAYWGLDAAGAPVELVVDFQVFDHHGTIVRAQSA